MELSMKSKALRRMFLSLLSIIAFTGSYGAGGPAGAPGGTLYMRNTPHENAFVQSTVPREKVDPNLAEHYYQEALLHLGKNNTKKAVELLKLYVQTGANPRQVMSASALVAQYDRP
jgi:hypothetical protein